MIRFIKPGDWLVISLSMIFTAFLFARIWHAEGASRILIRKGGQVFLETSLYRDRKIVVPGPLGLSKIVISNGAARVAEDPGPRQYCVKQGWLRNAGDAAICLPNQVSVELLGGKRRYDSLNY